jgi:hypothetical protein
MLLTNDIQFVFVQMNWHFQKEIYVVILHTSHLLFKILTYLSIYLFNYLFFMEYKLLTYLSFYLSNIIQLTYYLFNFLTYLNN